MVDEVHTDVAAAPAKKMSPLERALVGAAILIVGVTGVVALQGGKPASVWFYPYTAVLGAIGIYRIYSNKNYGELKAVPGESTRRSFEWALVEAVVTAVLWLGALVLLTTDLSLLRSQSFVPVLVVYVAYCRRRGVKPSTKTTFLMALAWLAWYAVFLELWRAFR